MKLSEDKSSLIKELTYDASKQQMSVVYRSDGAKFVYNGISSGLYGSLTRAKHVGETWVRIRDNYDHKRV